MNEKPYREPTPYWELTGTNEYTLNLDGVTFGLYLDPASRWVLRLPEYTSHAQPSVKERADAVRWANSVLHEVLISRAKVAKVELDRSNKRVLAIEALIHTTPIRGERL